MKKIVSFMAVTATVLSLSSVVAHADNMRLDVLEITPVCADGSANVAYWNVNNKNAVDVNIDWTALDNNHTGSFDAPAGKSQFTTYYEATDPNNTTEFKSEGTDDVTRNSSNTACQPGDITIVTPTDPGNGGGTTGGQGGGTGTATTTTGTVLGASTTATSPATAAAAPQLAYTGASRVMPLMAAAVIAGFTAVTSVLVRKNVL